MIGASNGCKKGGQRILAPDAMPCLAQKGVPLPVVDRFVHGMVIGKDSHGDLLEPLPAQTDIELLKAKLRIHAKQFAEVAQRVLLLIG